MQEVDLLFDILFKSRETMVTMTTRQDNLVTGMTEVDQENWEETLSSIVKRLVEMADEAGHGDLGDIGLVEKQVKNVRQEQMNLDDPVLIRELDGLLSEVMKLLNDAETEIRREQDEGHRHLEKCQDFGRDAKGLSIKFKGLEGRI